MSRDRAVVAGVGYSQIARRSEHTALKFALDAALDALADAGLGKEDIDGLVTCASAPNRAARHDDGVDDISMFIVEEAMGLKNLRLSLDTDIMSASMVAAAAQAVATGTCRCVLIVKAHYNDPAVRYSSADIEAIGGPPQYVLPYGLGLGLQRAMWLQRYMHLHGARREHLYPVIQASRRHAALNEKAIWRDVPLSLEQYMAGRWVCEPMSVYDCDMPVCGAGALIIVNESLGRELRKPLAYIKGWSTQNHVGDMLAANGLTPRDLAVAQLYDGYSPFVLYWLERLGFCGEGEAWRFIQDGAIEIGGKLALNTFGGSLGEGRLHGIGHVREGAMQAMGRAGARQVTRGGGHCLVQVGVPENSWVVLFGSDA